MGTHIGLLPLRGLAILTEVNIAIDPAIIAQQHRTGIANSRINRWVEHNVPHIDVAVTL